MQLTQLDNVYRLDDLMDPDGAPITPDGLYRAAVVDVCVRPGAVPIQLFLLQTGKLLLARRVETATVCLPKGTQVYADTVWWEKDGFAGTSVLIGDTWMFAANAPLVTNRTYQLSGHYSGQGQAPRDGLMAGSKLRTENGMMHVSRVRPGDRVWTQASGMRDVQAVYKRTSAALGFSAPIVIKAGTLNATHDLVLPPDQAVTLCDACVEGYLGAKNRTAQIGDLVNGDTIWRAQLGFATYVLLDLGGPACVNVNGVLVHLSGGEHLGRQRGNVHVALSTMVGADEGPVVGALL